MIVRPATSDEARGLLPVIIPHPWRMEQESYSGMFLTNPGLRATLIVSLTWYRRQMREELWKHVSLAIADRTPTWKEMEDTRIWTCGADSIAYQVHPPRREWVNDHPFVLHLFSPIEDRERHLPDFRMEIDGGYTL